MNVKDFGAKGDGQTDDTEVLQRAVSECDGFLFFPRGDYLIKKTVQIELPVSGRIGIDGGGSATIIMAGPGPAIKFKGTHHRPANPEFISEDVWEKERMPMIRDIEISGRHEDARGVELEGTMQVLLSGLLIRKCRHGIHFVSMNRNALIYSCHIYDNRECGIYFDETNLHQVNVASSHISYNLGGGIKVYNSQIRNLQITGNDIEYNYSLESEESADVWFYIKEGAIREGAITSNTIQAQPSPGGANVKMEGPDENARQKIGFFSISGNLISGQSVNIDLKYVRGLTISGNSFHSGFERSIKAEYSSDLVIGPNVFDNNPDYGSKPVNGIFMDNCSGCTLNGCHFSGAGADPVFMLKNCREINMVGCYASGCAGTGVLLENCRGSRISSCLFSGQAISAGTKDAVKESGGGGNLLNGNHSAP